MNAIRSVVFNFFFVVGSFVMSILLLWTLVFPKKTCARLAGGIYGAYIQFICTKIMGIHLELRGLENIPKDSLYIIAAKHQSAYETMTIPFMGLFGYPVIILKRELTWLPIWGWFPARMGEVPVDRGSGMAAMNSITRGCKAAVADGRNLAIFPQGTRVPVGKQAPYKPGIAKLYKDLELPVIPMALNSGVFWGRYEFFKRAGTIVFEFLPPIMPGLPVSEMMERLERETEMATDRLVEEGRASLK